MTWSFFISKMSRRPTDLAHTSDPAAEKWPSPMTSLNREQPCGCTPSCSAATNLSRWALMKESVGFRNIRPLSSRIFAIFPG